MYFIVVVIINVVDIVVIVIINIITFVVAAGERLAFGIFTEEGGRQGDNIS